MAEHDKRLIYLISRSVSRLKYYSIERFSSEGVTVTPSQMGILFLLSKEKEMTMSEISLILNVDNSTLTRLADRLEKQELIERVRDSSDRRVSRLRITKRGFSESAKALKITKDINNKIREGFNDSEIEIFIKVLESFFKKF